MSGSPATKWGETTRRPTASQTVGPFFGFALPWDDGPFAVPAGSPGSIRIAGLVRDGAGAPVGDALLETWQADPEGRFSAAADGFRGFARTATNPEGWFELSTLKPGPVPGPGTTTQAPHLAVSIFARGLLTRLVTRIYFADEGALNDADPVLTSLPTASRQTLLAAPDGEGGYRFDVNLQGEDETVFFAI